MLVGKNHLLLCEVWDGFLPLPLPTLFLQTKLNHCFCWMIPRHGQRNGSWTAGFLFHIQPSTFTHRNELAITQFAKKYPQLSFLFPVFFKEKHPLFRRWNTQQTLSSIHVAFRWIFLRNILPLLLGFEASYLGRFWRQGGGAAWSWQRFMSWIMSGNVMDVCSKKWLISWKRTRDLWGKCYVFVLQALLGNVPWSINSFCLGWSSRPFYW